MRGEDASRSAVTARLRRLGELAALRPDRRFETKVDLTSAAVTRRLQEQSRLRGAGRRLMELGRGARADRQ